MSRTDKDRPYWVKVNDPDSDRVPYHRHVVSLVEYLGEEPVYRTGFDGREYFAYMHGLYSRWSEDVDCTIDRKEAPPSTWRFRFPRKTDNDQTRNAKHCGFELRHDNWYSGSNTRYWKRKGNQAIRHKINERLNQALYELPDDVDIFSDSKYIRASWWD